MGIVRLAHVVNGHPLTGIDAPSQIRLFVVSGVRLVREGLARSVQTRRRIDIAVIGCAGFSEAETASIAELRPDVILVDLANHEGIAAAQTLRVALSDLEAGRVLGRRHGGGRLRLRGRGLLRLRAPRGRRR